MWKVLKHGASGTYHQIKHLPYQDAFESFVSGEIVGGFLLDGCSGSPYSQVGARLAAQYLTREAEIFATVYQYKGQELATALFDTLIHYLKCLVQIQRLRAVEERDRFISDYLLFTVAGFVITPETSYGLMCGDNILLINGLWTHEDQDNKPTYPGYCLLSNPVSEKVPDGFHLWEIDTDEVEMIGVASDAFVEHPEFLEQVRQMKTQAKLQLAINRWTEVEQLFKDDTSVVLARREE